MAARGTQTKKRSAGASARARKAGDAGRRAAGAATGRARRGAPGRARRRETAPRRVIGRLRGLSGSALGFAGGRSQTALGRLRRSAGGTLGGPRAARRAR